MLGDGDRRRVRSVHASSRKPSGKVHRDAAALSRTRLHCGRVAVTRDNACARLDCQHELRDPSSGGGLVSTPAEWKADPTRRHELRYWDGTNWTEHVSDGGTQSTDPVAVEDAGTSPVTSFAMNPSDQTVIWEGSKKTVAASASGGRLTTARYRVTQDAVHFEAGLLSTKAEMIPLWTVVDVDLAQSMTQKAR